MNGIEMIEEFVCPGCVCGSNTKCGKYKAYEGFANYTCCRSHVLGTSILDTGNFALGLPKGFNRAGLAGNGQLPMEQRNNTILIRCWPDSKDYKWDKFNVPVWAMELGAFLYVRIFMPRINFSCIDVIKGGTLALVPNAINVADFFEEMD